MPSDESQHTEWPRLGTTVWPPGLLLPIPDRWPPDFATRELLDVDARDPDQVTAFLTEWGDPASPFDHARHVDAAGLLIDHAQRCALVIREVAIATQQDRAPRPSVLLAAMHAALTDLDTGQPVAVPADAGADPSVAAAAVGSLLVEPFLAHHLQWAYPRLAVVGFEHEPEPLTWADAVAGQLFNYVSQRTPWQQCGNEPAHTGGRGRWFTVQRTDRRKPGGYGPRGADTARFCSRQCARAFTERQRRRRQRDTREEHS